MKQLPMLRVTGECNRCGDCCRVVTLTKMSVDRIKRDRRDEDGRLHVGVAPGHGDDLHDMERCERWMRDELHELTPEEAEARVPGITQSVGETQGMYRCDNFDEETNLCRSHHDKPSICADFPAYDFNAPNGHVIDKGILDGLPRCGYKIEVINES